MRMESSTTKATTDVTSPRTIGPGLALKNDKLPEPGKELREDYLGDSFAGQTWRQFSSGVAASRQKHPPQNRKTLSRFVFQPGVFDHHVLKLTRFEDVAALRAFDEFGVFLAGHNLHARVLTLIHRATLLRGWRRRD